MEGAIEPLIDPILIGVVVLSVLPALVHWLRSRREPAVANPSADRPTRD